MGMSHLQFFSKVSAMGISHMIVSTIGIFYTMFSRVSAMGWLCVVGSINYRSLLLSIVSFIGLFCFFIQCSQELVLGMSHIL